MTILRPALDAVFAHALEERPRECCGVLIGKGDTILRAVRARNLSDNPKRFVLDPADHIQARRAARDEDLDVLGFYHSHPMSPAAPSETDLAEVTYTDAVHLIVGMLEGVAEARLFRLTNDAAAEEPLRCRE